MSKFSSNLKQVLTVKGILFFGRLEELSNFFPQLTC